MCILPKPKIDTPNPAPPPPVPEASAANQPLALSETAGGSLAEQLNRRRAGLSALRIDRAVSGGAGLGRSGLNIS